MENRQDLDKFVSKVFMEIYEYDRTGRLLYLFARRLSVVSKLKAFGIDDENKFVVIPQERYKRLIAKTSFKE